MQQNDNQASKAKEREEKCSPQNNYIYLLWLSKQFKGPMK